MGEAKVKARLRAAGLPVPPPRERVTRYVPVRLAGDLRAAESLLQAAAGRAGRPITEDQAFAAILRAGLATLPVERSGVGSPQTPLTSPAPVP